MARTSVLVAGLKFDQLIVALPDRRREFPAQAEVQGQLRSYAPVVLHVERVDVLPQVGDQVVAQRDGAGQAEIEVGQIVSVASLVASVAGRAAALRRGRLAELPGVGVRAVQRVDVENFRADGQELVAHLEECRPLIIE